MPGRINCSELWSVDLLNKSGLWVNILSASNLKLPCSLRSLIVISLSIFLCFLTPHLHCIQPNLSVPFTDKAVTAFSLLLFFSSVTYYGLTFPYSSFASKRKALSWHFTGDIAICKMLLCLPLPF